MEEMEIQTQQDKDEPRNHWPVRNSTITRERKNPTNQRIKEQERVKASRTKSSWYRKKAPRRSPESKRKEGSQAAKKIKVRSLDGKHSWSSSSKELLKQGYGLTKKTLLLSFRLYVVKL